MHTPATQILAAASVQEWRLFLLALLEDKLRVTPGRASMVCSFLDMLYTLFPFDQLLVCLQL